MIRDQRNLNTLWASVLIDSLVYAGLRWAVISPGSRSAPLAFALAANPAIQKAVILDERAAGFFALGLARRLQQPVVLVCTSGTAAANYFPAVIEAYYSQVPLLVLTADRPSQLRHCQAGQTIDQVRLYGNYPLWQAELAMPAIAELAYLQHMSLHAWQQAQTGPVHLNVPFSEPLIPVVDPAIANLELTLDWPPQALSQPPLSPSLPWDSWRQCDRGVIVVGKQNAPDLSRVAAVLGWPILADTLSGQRQPGVIGHYDQILAAAIPPPELVIQVGTLPTSKHLRQWLAAAQPQTWVSDAGRLLSDPLHNPSLQLPGSVADWVVPDLPPRQTSYARQWQQWQAIARDVITTALKATPTLHEASIAAIAAAALPAGTAICVASSTPVRDLEWFWPCDRGCDVWFASNRGANGIDGTIATALGIAATGVPTVLITGDLAFLHDSSALLIRPRGKLTVILINNNGGGIFALLPVSDYEPPYTDYFATPQTVDFAALCQAHAIAHHVITNRDELSAALSHSPDSMRVLEIRTDRSSEAVWRRQVFAEIKQAVAAAVYQDGGDSRGASI